MMLKKIVFVCILIGMLACEDKVNVTLQDAPEALVVDAWVNDKNETQVIRLTKTQPYFDSSVPTGVSGALVSIERGDGVEYVFEESANGEYTWDPAASGQTIDMIGADYTLKITAEDQRYEAHSVLNRVPAIDSITFTYKEERNPFQPAGYYGEFVATDPVGLGDTYWIKSYKNGVLLNRPFELNIAYDAGFNEGGNIDGLVFIQPIQDAVNPFNDDLSEVVPYQPGDSLFVEIHSIPNEAFHFLQEMQIQTQRDGGFDEIFAEPVENLQSNIVNVSSSPAGQVVGYFCMSAVSGMGAAVNE